MKTISQREVLFTLVGGVVGVGFMAGLIMFTDLGKEHMRDMDMSLNKQELEAKWKKWGMQEAAKANGMHMMPDGTLMKNDGSHTDMDMTTMDPMAMSMNDMAQMMDGKTGNELDIAFLEGMIPHHQGAVDMANALLKGTDRPEMKDFARDIISAQTAEIAKMKVWLEAWARR